MNTDFMLNLGTVHFVDRYLKCYLLPYFVIVCQVFKMLSSPLFCNCVHLIDLRLLLYMYLL